MRTIQKYYDLLSKFYDQATQGPHAWTPPHEIEALLLPLVKPGTEVLDAGIGTGQAAVALAERGARICGLDLSTEMIAKAREKIPQAELLQADLDEELTILAGRRFEVVIACGVLEFVTDLPKTLTELSKHVKPGGHFCFTIEEYLEGDELQGARASESGAGSTKAHEFSKFLHYRHTLDEVLAVLNKLGLETRSHKQFVAYYKTEAKLPVVYQMIHATRPE